MSQAAVSWQVKALEQRLDQPLFRRLPREVVLTPAGERLARAAAEAMGLLRGAVADLSASGDGVLSITTLQSFASQWLAPRLGGFQLAHPEIAVRLDTSTRLMDLMREDMDIGIRAGLGEWPGLESQLLFPTVFTPLCAPGMAASLGDPPRPAALIDAPRIGVEFEWTMWFQAAGIEPPGPAQGSPRLSADAMYLEVAAALSGQGFALASPILFAGEIASGRLQQPFEVCAHDDSLGRGYWLVYPKDRRRVRKIAAFRDWVAAEVVADPTAQTFLRTLVPT